MSVTSSHFLANSRATSLVPVQTSSTLLPGCAPLISTVALRTPLRRKRARKGS